MKAVAVDDEPKALEVIRDHSLKISFLDLVEVFSDPFKALDYLNENAVDVIFLDINMPDISGLEFSRIIKKTNIPVIFTTAYSDYAVESYEVEAVDYLLKPIEFERFHTAVIRAKEQLNILGKPENEFFFVNSGRERTKIRYDDIIYVEGDGNYMIYQLKNTEVMVRSTIKETLARLPSAGFFQIQRSYIVALKHIAKIQDNHVYLREKRISIGQNYKEAFKSIVDSFG